MSPAELVVQAIAKVSDQHVMIALSSYPERKYNWLQRKLRIWLGIEDLVNFAVVNLAMRVQNLENKG